MVIKKGLVDHPSSIERRNIVAPLAGARLTVSNEG
jgi:hypothetical protein